MPWPLGSLIASTIDSNELFELAARADKGEFGDFEDWKNAEQRWTLHGISEEDFRVGVTGFWFDRRVAQAGAPGFQRLRVTYGRPGGLDLVARLFSLAADISNPKLLSQIIHAADFSISAVRTPPRLTITQVEQLLEAFERCEQHEIDLMVFKLIDPNAWNSADIVNRITGLAARCHT